jgi:hypothetical protein
VSETRKARKTIKEAKRNPNCLEPRAMIWAIKARPQAMGWRIRARVARSAFELTYSVPPKAPLICERG